MTTFAKKTKGGFSYRAGDDISCCSGFGFGIVTEHLR